MTTYSHSRLSVFESCPRAYKYRYIDRVELEPESESIEAFMGSRVHETLEKLYRDLRLSKENTLEELLAHYADAWHRNWHENVRIVKKGYTPENYFDTGARCIASYYRRYHPFNESRTLGLEQVIFIDIEGYRLRGFIDRLALREDGHYEIHDYKTSQYLPPLKHFQRDRQLALYQIGVEEMWGDAEEVDLVWHYLVHEREIRVKRAEEEIEEIKAQVVEQIRKIERAEEEDNFPAVESSLCPWCEFQPLCPSFAHIVKTGGMPRNRYLEEPGVKLVNRYAALMREKREFLKRIDAELQQVKEALVNYARREGVEVVAGSDVKARVKIRQVCRYPTKGKRARKELEMLIKQAGIWEELSDLNLHALNRAVGSGRLDSTLVERLAAYQKLEEECRIYLSKRRDVEE